MEQSYLEVVERLQAYRRAQRKTQQEMSADLGVTQSHYAKLESGANIISYDCLKTFERNGGDVHFLITGQYLTAGILDSYMTRCRSEEGRLQLFRFMIWIVELGLKLEGEDHLPETVYTNLKLAQELLDRPESIWKSIRRINHMTQFQMADILGINIKRYLRLEKEVTRPDAEILNQLYVRLSYAPLLIMEPPYYYLRECNMAWEHFSDSIKGKLQPMLVQAAKLVLEGEEMD